MSRISTSVQSSLGGARRAGVYRRAELMVTAEEPYGPLKRNLQWTFSHHVGVEPHLPACFHAIARPWKALVLVLVFNIGDVGTDGRAIAHCGGCIGDHDPGELVLIVER